MFKASHHFPSEYVSAFVLNLCDSTFKQLPYPEDFDHFDQDDEEVEFLTFRNNVEGLYKVIILKATLLC
jgi:hypothetical protein